MLKRSYLLRACVVQFAAIKHSAHAVTASQRILKVRREVGLYSLALVPHTAYFIYTLLYYLCTTHL